MTSCNHVTCQNFPLLSNDLLPSRHLSELSVTLAADRLHLWQGRFARFNDSLQHHFASEAQKGIVICLYCAILRLIWSLAVKSLSKDVMRQNNQQCMSIADRNSSRRPRNLYHQQLSSTLQIQFPPHTSKSNQHSLELISNNYSF